MTAPAASPRTLSVTNVSNATNGQAINLSRLISVIDPSNVGYQTLELWDSKGTVTGGEFKVNGAVQPAGQIINVSPSNIANTVFYASTAGGIDTLWAQLLESDGTLSGWQQFSVTVPAPTLSVSSVPSATKGQVISLANLVSVYDAGNVSFQKLELWDANGTVIGGQFKINGTAQSGAHEIDVAPANLANVVFDVGTAGGTDTLWARLSKMTARCPAGCSSRSRCRRRP